MRTSLGLARYQAAEQDLLAGPNRGVTALSTRGCLFFAPRGTTAPSALVNVNGEAILRGLADAGIPTVSADWGGGTTWGNDTAVTRAGTGRTYQQTAQGVKTDKVVLVGASMGSITALRYTMANPTKVSAIALILGAPDVQGMYDANIAGMQAEIGAAYGARPSNAQNPASNTASFAGIPIRAWYATDDTTALPAPLLAFITATGGVATSLGAVGHSLLTVDPQQVVSFLAPFT